nr:trimethylamine methyltransferase family protein [Mesorhizobium sp. M2A.F.Ca.ET.037.01.1.1]
MVYGSFSSNVDMKSGAPGRTIWASVNPASASACCKVSAPATVIGAIAPARQKGVMIRTWPALAKSMMPCAIGISS